LATGLLRDGQRAPSMQEVVGTVGLMGSASTRSSAPGQAQWEKGSLTPRLKLVTAVVAKIRKRTPLWRAVPGLLSVAHG
jgi:hypothetical protein